MNAEPDGPLPRQASLNRLRRFDVRPNRELGQNFLIDDNLLARDRARRGAGAGGRGARGGRRARRAVGVPRPAGRSPPRGGGRPLARAPAARRARSVPQRHAAPGRRREARSRRRSIRRRARWWPTCRTAWPRPCCFEPSRSWPTPRSGSRWSSARWATAWPRRPGGKSYGATSVLAQLACDVTVVRRVPRTVFHPKPNVESALVALRRTGPAPARESRPWSTRRSPTGARRSRARWRWRPARPDGMREAPARRSWRSATRRTPARSGSRRRTSRAWPTCSATNGLPASAERERVMTERAPAKVNLVLEVGPARAGRAARRWRRCSPRSTSPTS